MISALLTFIAKAGHLFDSPVLSPHVELQISGGSLSFRRLCPTDEFYSTRTSSWRYENVGARLKQLRCSLCRGPLVLSGFGWLSSTIGRHLPLRCAFCGTQTIIGGSSVETADCDAIDRLSKENDATMCLERIPQEIVDRAVESALAEISASLSGATVSNSDREFVLSRLQFFSRENT